MREDSLLYCAFAIAVFDLLCAALFAALSLGLMLSHLSWLTIFCACFGIFWLSLILVLISGIYRRDSDLVWYWIIFSCCGIFVEFILIIYAFISNSTFQAGIIRNSYLLCLSLFVETIFAFIIYQFYLAVSKCDICTERCSKTDLEYISQRSQSSINTTPQQESRDSGNYRRSSRKSSQSYRHNIK